jgi:hypothetical protein
MNRQGSVALLILPISVLISAALGLVAIEFHWRRVVATQLRLDRCIAKTALELKASIQRVDAMNSKIRALRLAIPPALIKPPVAKALQESLRALVFVQDAELRRWNGLRRTQWLLQRGCGHRSDRAAPLPEQPWMRPPSDPIGPHALVWPESTRLLQLSVLHVKRSSHAQIEKNESSWRVRWASFP